MSSWQLSDETTRILDLAFYGNKENPTDYPLGLERFKDRLSQRNLDVDDEEVEYYYKRQAFVQIHQRPPLDYIPHTQRSKPYPLRTHVYQPFQHMQADTLFLDEKTIANTRVPYAFVLVDMITRFMFLYPMKSTSGDAVHRAFEAVIGNPAVESNFQILTTDQGPEFQQNLESWLKSKLPDFQEHRQAPIGDKRAVSIVETAIRTLRQVISRINDTQEPNNLNFWGYAVAVYNSLSHTSLLRKTPEEAVEILSKNDSQKSDFLDELTGRYDTRMSLVTESPQNKLVQVGDVVRVRLRAANLGLCTSKAMLNIAKMCILSRV